MCFDSLQLYTEHLQYTVREIYAVFMGASEMKICHAWYDLVSIGKNSSVKPK